MTELKPLTKRQQFVLDFMRDYAGTNGMPPAVREVAEAIGAASVNAAAGHIAQLIEKGYLARMPGARGIRFLTGPCPFCGGDAEHG